MHSDADNAADSQVGDVVTLPAAELRESLDNILTAVTATAHTCAAESRALEEQRQRVFSLLRKLDSRESSPQPRGSIELYRSGDLLSPPTETQTPSQALRATASCQTAAWATYANTHTPTPAHRCLIANLFAQPRTAPTYCSPPPQPRASSPPTVRVGAAGASSAARESEAPYGAARAADISDPAGAYPRPPQPTSSLRLSSRSRNAHINTHGSDDSETSTELDTRRLRSPTLSRARHVPRQPSHALVQFHDAQVPHTFWINVWPCCGGTMASRTRHATRVLVQDKCRYFGEVLQKAAELTSCRPPSHSLYTPDGRCVRDLDGLVAEQHYLLFPAGGFYRRQSVPTALLWLLYTDARHLVQCT